MNNFSEVEISNHAFSSLIRNEKDIDLSLSHHAEIQEISSIPCFFWGRIKEPFLVAKCLTTISKTVRSRFALTAQELAALRDPIVTSGNEQIRFEGFSSCNGVYARLDLMPNHVDGEFIASGTTNVDFNEPMINALSSVKKEENMILSVGSKEVTISTDKGKNIEKKVALPNRWIKGLTSVQHYLSEMNLVFELNKINAIQLFQSFPKSIKSDLFIVKRANKYMFSTLESEASVRIGSAHRLRLIDNLLPFIDSMFIYQSEDKQASTFVLMLSNLRFTITFSADAYRGFSGEGKALEHLITDIPLDWVMSLNNQLEPNKLFQPSMMAIENDISFTSSDALIANLSSMGMLGFDLIENQHFYRRLPFKMQRILSLNPRLKNAQKLLQDEDVKIINQSPSKVEANVKGSDGIPHTVVIDDNKSRCTCKWYLDHQNERGNCKHILAVKILVN
ncbi:SWIM zinc finger family protein [Flavobacterium sp.]|jgi:hypothetical protein|uniref:SWIM zinc finger family protein n=1 Tax=Flavobacterium sp. TaxID=239 RepID=UPI0037BF1C8C